MQFNINNITYSIRLSEHAELRMSQRNIDQLHIVAAIMSLGTERIESYNNSDRDLMIIDKQNNFSTVLNIENNKIYVITLIDKTDVFVKPETDIISL